VNDHYLINCPESSHFKQVDMQRCLEVVLPQNPTSVAIEGSRQAWTSSQSSLSQPEPSIVFTDPDDNETPCSQDYHWMKVGEASEQRAEY